MTSTHKVLGERPPVSFLWGQQASGRSVTNERVLGRAAHIRSLTCLPLYFTPPPPLTPSRFPRLSRLSRSEGWASGPQKCRTRPSNPQVVPPPCPCPCPPRPRCLMPGRNRTSCSRVGGAQHFGRGSGADEWAAVTAQWARRPGIFPQRPRVSGDHFLDSSQGVQHRMLLDRRAVLHPHTLFTIYTHLRVPSCRWCQSLD